jgi:hypothetical protein
MIDLASDCRVCWDEAENVRGGEVFWGQDRIEFLADALSPAVRPIVRKREVKRRISKT